ncbi:MAG TPA: phosphoribosylglycinamide formyltransferase [Ktedonobacterales bacterium]|nr:phosphoribosylglycinamide formyltransferase [Ktedonobacterales bacterium]
MTTPHASAERPGIGVLVSGRGSNLQAILRAIESGELDARVALVISSRPDAPALEVAAAHGVATRVIVPKQYPSRAEAGAAIVAALRAAGARVVALAGYKPILDATVVQAFPNAILNVHPSLLPAFAGGMAPRPQADALAAGVKVTGCTVHFVTEEVDAGPIIAQAPVPVLDDDTVESLSARILTEEHRLLPLALGLALSDRLRIDGKRVTIR